MTFDHLSLVASDFAASRAFFVAGHEPLGAAVVAGDDAWAIFGVSDLDGEFVVAQGERSPRAIGVR